MDTSYNLYSFLQSTGIYDYQYAIEIANLLNKNIHLLKHYDIDEITEIITSMSTTFTSPWLALAYTIKNNNLNYGLIGTLGGVISGKFLTFRHSPKIRNKQKLMNAVFDNFSKGVKYEDVSLVLPIFRKYNVKESFYESYNNYNESNLYDTELLFSLDYKMFKNISILHKSSHFITPIHPYFEKHISQKYFSLPIHLIKSQKTHTILSSKNSKSNKIKSTTFPVSLRNEKYFREIITIANKINALLKGKLLSKKLSKIAPVYDSSEFTPQSSYFLNLLETPSIQCPNKRLLSRLKNTDNFFKFTFDASLNNFCHKIEMIEVVSKNENIKTFKELYLKTIEQQ